MPPTEPAVLATFSIDPMIAVPLPCQTSTPRAISVHDCRVEVRARTRDTSHALQRAHMFIAGVFEECRLRGIESTLSISIRCCRGVCCRAPYSDAQSSLQPPLPPDFSTFIFAQLTDIKSRHGPELAFMRLEFDRLERELVPGEKPKRPRWPAAGRARTRSPRPQLLSSPRTAV